MPNQVNKKHPVCEKHWYMGIARTHFKDGTLWLALRDKMIIQNYTCPYTGERLIIGENASLDHILPQKRFPEYIRDINNTEWICWEVNDMKKNRTKEEFLAIIHLISRKDRT